MPSRLLIDASFFLGKVWALARPYWKSEERGRAWALLIAIIAMTLALVYVDVRFNEWYREFYNSLEQKNQEDFMVLLLFFTFLAVLFLALSIYKLYLTQMLTMRWRVWLTRQYLAEWLDRQVYYRLQLDAHGTDNPDQRIAEDLRLFTDGTLDLSLGLLQSVVTLVSFVVILWSVSGSMELFGIEIPGYLVWAALLYAILGSVLAHFVGRQLIPINFQKERYEADFRFNLVRLRENAEGVALYRGEGPEQEALLSHFERIRLNWWSLMNITKRLTGFTAGYNQVAVIFPYVVAAPRYFSGAMPLGGLMQITSAFGQVQTSLSWFVDSYRRLAPWKASVDRLLTFQSALDQATAEAERHDGVQTEMTQAHSVQGRDIELSVPGGRMLLSGGEFEFAPGQRTLLTGPSGSGKSTLFRAIAGIWPYGKGRVAIPSNARVLFLPQKPYIPIGTLRDAVSFPAASGDFTDETIRTALVDCRLEPFAVRLDESAHWQQLLSGGEQQRLAMARALLNRPDYLFLDEATASLDEDTEAWLYRLLRERLPDTAIVSIAHRPAVAGYHEHKLQLVPEGSHMRLQAA
ncbi:MAG: ABC transporter ATP-binding protein [Betaproteobacteria bacterium RIFCSPLOWO2_02_FULL_62_17]|nr:MAG: ABC transporter ATP-binding protein [Betaproteobacteria bacterium RIFCSPLOWO2_02_FULL_62_17]